MMNERQRYGWKLLCGWLPPDEVIAAAFIAVTGVADL
jgi:hypothetical protein